MKKKETLSRREQKDLDIKLAGLKESPDDPMALSRVGYLLTKAGENEEALSYLLQAFESFVKTGQYSMAVMVADELLAVQVNNVEIMHKLAQISDQKDIEIPVMEIYKKYKGFHKVPLFTALGKMEFLQLLKASDYHDLKQGSTIIKEGAKGDDIFLIVEGRVDVTKKNTRQERFSPGNSRKRRFSWRNRVSIRQKAQRHNQC